MIRKAAGKGWEDDKTARGILACLEDGGALSRAAVAKRLDLSRTTLTNLIARLMDMGLVSEQEGADPRGRGRPGIPVDLDTSTWFSLGAAFHSGRWVFAVVNLRGDVVAAHAAASASRDPKSFLSALTRGIGVMRGRVPGRLLPGVGIGAPGLVNFETGMMIRADDLGWERIDIGGAVRKATGLAAYVVNRNRAAGIAEARYGLGRNVANFVYIGVGTGISAAVMLDGDLLHGSTYSAGEIGHIVVDPGGPPCGCGNRGCLQTLAAEGALVRRAREMRVAGEVPPRSRLGGLFRERGDVDGPDVCRAAALGDAAAAACVRDAARWLGRETGNLITALNPEKIIFGGPLVRAGAVLVDCVREEAAKWAMRHPLSSVSIEASSLDDYAGARGAACLVLRNKLELSAAE